MFAPTATQLQQYQDQNRGQAASDSTPSLTGAAIGQRFIGQRLKTGAAIAAAALALGEQPQMAEEVLFDTQGISHHEQLPPLDWATNQPLAPSGAAGSLAFMSAMVFELAEPVTVTRVNYQAGSNQKIPYEHPPAGFFGKIIVWLGVDGSPAEDAWKVDPIGKGQGLPGRVLSRELHTDHYTVHGSVPLGGNAWQRSSLVDDLELPAGRHMVGMIGGDFSQVQQSKEGPESVIYFYDNVDFPAEDLTQLADAGLRWNYTRQPLFMTFFGEKQQTTEPERARPFITIEKGPTPDVVLVTVYYQDGDTQGQMVLERATEARGDYGPMDPPLAGAEEEVAEPGLGPDWFSQQVSLTMPGAEDQLYLRAVDNRPPRSP